MMHDPQLPNREVPRHASRRQRCRRLLVERLEERTPLAADAFDALSEADSTLDIGHLPSVIHDWYDVGSFRASDAHAHVAAAPFGAESWSDEREAFWDMEREPQVAFRLEATNMAGEIVGDVSVGESLIVNVYVDDLRWLRDKSEGGVFSAYFHLSYNPETLRLAGELDYGDSFPNYPSGEFSEGRIEYAGSFGGLTPPGSDEQLVVAIPFYATAEGTAELQLEFAESVFYEIGVYGWDDPIPREEIIFDRLALEVHANQAGSDSPPPAVDVVFSEPLQEQVEVEDPGSAPLIDADSDSEHLDLRSSEVPETGEYVAFHSSATDWTITSFPPEYSFLRRPFIWSDSTVTGARHDQVFEDVDLAARLESPILHFLRSQVVNHGDTTGNAFPVEVWVESSDLSSSFLSAPRLGDGTIVTFGNGASLRYKSVPPSTHRVDLPIIIGEDQIRSLAPGVRGAVEPATGVTYALPPGPTGGVTERRLGITPRLLSSSSMRDEQRRLAFERSYLDEVPLASFGSLKPSRSSYQFTLLATPLVDLQAWTESPLDRSRSSDTARSTLLGERSSSVYSSAAPVSEEGESFLLRSRSKLLAELESAEQRRRMLLDRQAAHDAVFAEVNSATENVADQVRVAR